MRELLKSNKKNFYFYFFLLDFNDDICYAGLAAFPKRRIEREERKKRFLLDKTSYDHLLLFTIKIVIFIGLNCATFCAIFFDELAIRQKF